MNSAASSRPTIPLLIYDGDCSFCKFWVEYWKSLTGDRISYRPYQEVWEHFPDIPLSAFQKAAQFVDAGGNVSSGAEAVFQSLAYCPGKRWMNWGYRHIPTARPVADAAYAFIARHRSGLYRFTRLLWGERLERPRFEITRSICLRLLGVIYLLAFASWLPQVRALAGSDGILPAQRFLATAYRELGSQAHFLYPTLFWLHPTDRFLQLLTGTGMVLSIPVILGIASGPSLLLLWAFYLSQVIVGTSFMLFQWDSLLLEAGFLAIFFAPWNIRNNRAEPSLAMVWLFRWLVFRVFFLSGVIKLVSGNPTWRNLTALSFHFQTQPLPNVIAWYLFQWPLTAQKFSTAFTLAVEIFVPLLIFTTRRFRIVAAWLLIALQVLILLTGNYAFFNWLTIVLCLFLLDDAYFQYLPQSIRNRLRARPPATAPPVWRRVAIAIFALVIVTASSVVSAASLGLDIPRPFLRIMGPLQPFYITSSYGLFASMTTTRPEIIVEGSNDGQQWLPYEFKYKPGDLGKAPRWVAPYQPRLDWQMWFAALGSYQNNRWFINFVVRLLEGSPEVLHLLATNPFPDHPPRYIRALLYDYRFTSFDERKATGNWWARELLGSYLPPVSRK